MCLPSHGSRALYFIGALINANLSHRMPTCIEIYRESCGDQGGHKTKANYSSQKKGYF